MKSFSRRKYCDWAACALVGCWSCCRRNFLAMDVAPTTAVNPTPRWRLRSASTWTAAKRSSYAATIRALRTDWNLPIKTISCIACICFVTRSCNQKVRTADDYDSKSTTQGSLQPVNLPVIFTATDRLAACFMIHYNLVIVINSENVPVRFSALMNTYSNTVAYAALLQNPHMLLKYLVTPFYEEPLLLYVTLYSINSYYPSLGSGSDMPIFVIRQLPSSSSSSSSF